MIRNKKNKNINRLLQTMKKLSIDINDNEICRRLEILMYTEKEDLPKKPIDLLFEQGTSFDPRTLPEPYTQYVRHLLYMIRRESKQGGILVPYISEGHAVNLSAMLGKIPKSAAKKKLNPKKMVKEKGKSTSKISKISKGSRTKKSKKVTKKTTKSSTKKANTKSRLTNPAKAIKKPAKKSIKKTSKKIAKKSTSKVKGKSSK